MGNTLKWCIAGLEKYLADCPGFESDMRQRIQDEIDKAKNPAPLSAGPSP